MTLADWIVVGLTHRRRWARAHRSALLERRWLREERGHVPTL
jgi:hypothetical protein